MNNKNESQLLLPSGGYRRLKSFQLARVVYDVTMRFVEFYIPRDSRTADQMVQAARSGVQNIAEGSVDAATSAKLELNLYNVARGSLEELRLDYQDFLRHAGFSLWTREADVFREFVSRRVSTNGEFREFIAWAENHFGGPKEALVANAALLLIDTAVFFLKKQIETKARQFLQSGGFAERMSRLRRIKR